MVLALIFAELLAGGILITSGITGHSPTEVVEGQTKPWKSITKKGSETSPVPGLSTGETEGLFSGTGKASLEPLEPSHAGGVGNIPGKAPTKLPPAPNKVKIPEAINYKKLQELTKQGYFLGKKGEEALHRILKRENSLDEILKLNPPKKK